MSARRSSALQSYANTAVPSHRSKEQVEELLRRVGAMGFRWSSFGSRETLEAGLEWDGGRMAFRLQVDYEDDREHKQKLRALYWYLKAKVEAIQFGLVDLEQEFLPYMLTPSGRTVFEEIPEAQRRGWLLEAPKGEPSELGEKAT